MNLPYEVYRMMSPDGEQIIVTATRLPKDFNKVYAIQSSYLMENSINNNSHDIYGGIVDEKDFIEGMVKIEIGNL